MLLQRNRERSRAAEAEHVGPHKSVSLAFVLGANLSSLGREFSGYGAIQAGCEAKSDLNLTLESTFRHPGEQKAGAGEPVGKAQPG